MAWKIIMMAVPEPIGIAELVEEPGVPLCLSGHLAEPSTEKEPEEAKWAPLKRPRISFLGRCYQVGVVHAKASLVEEPSAEECPLLTTQAARDVHPRSAGQGLDPDRVGARLDDSEDLSGPLLRSSVESGLFEGGSVRVVLGETQRNYSENSRIVLDLEEEHERPLSVALEVKIGDVYGVSRDRVREVSLLDLVKHQVLRKELAVQAILICGENWGVTG